MTLRRVLLAAATIVSLSCATGSDAFAARRRAVTPPASHAENRDWARGAVFYEIFVRSFADSNGDGKGDFNGLTDKLDYVKSLGVDAIWLMPVFASPSYHGYDITNYEKIEPDYGTNADFARFLSEAHRRGIRVILDFVMNHTSSEHPWFIDSASSTLSAKREWYVWSDSNPGWTQPWGGDPSWHPLNGAYYYGVFWSGMPDLNYRTPAVKAEMFRLGRYWLSQGVDGFRLDATRYLVEDGPGAGQADTPETHQLLNDFSADMHGTKADAFIVAENTVDTYTLSTYFADGVSTFNFPLASAIVDGVSRSEPSRIRAVIGGMATFYPKDIIDAPFLTNHDQTRIATVLANNTNKLKNAAAILLTVPGAPFVYYGEEVGLQNGPTSADESKRTPMPWTASGGFTTGTPWFAYAPGLAANNVSVETNDPQSLLSYYRNWIAARHRSNALLKGGLTLVDSGTQLLAFTRDTADDHVLVVHNVSDTAATAVPIRVDAASFETIYADSGVATPSGGANAWSVSLPPRSSAAWRVRR